jgi:hypothetical protein
MVNENLKPFVGQHCESTTAGTLLNQLGLKYTEPMLFGLGEGLSYIFWNMKMMNFPFIGGRVKPDLLTENICRNLNLELTIKETSSINKAWCNVESNIKQNKAVGLKLDCYHLEYFSSKIHFAGHYVAMYGFDSDYAYLVDTDQQGGQVKTSLKSLEAARNEKGPMSSRNRSYTIQNKGVITNLEEAVLNAIINNTTAYLNPPIKNVSYKGIAKTATEIKKWFNSSKDIKGDFKTTAMLMEHAGTGGSIFRKLYKDFLKESYQLLKIEGINEAFRDFEEIAELWKHVSELFNKVGDTAKLEYIHRASEILFLLSEKERKAMQHLHNTCSEFKDTTAS